MSYVRHSKTAFASGGCSEATLQATSMKPIIRQGGERRPAPPPCVRHCVSVPSFVSSASYFFTSAPSIVTYRCPLCTVSRHQYTFSGSTGWYGAATAAIAHRAASAALLNCAAYVVTVPRMSPCGLPTRARQKRHSRTMGGPVGYRELGATLAWGSAGSSVLDSLSALLRLILHSSYRLT